ncbi:Quinic acid utilization activator [Smittium culicis]|uniref:Quinic acid utilization activator n=1 Tax=Smittium culicis TaxID=133412 RepID=A0A1R1YR92_9FUNG|nr:Quinic acid utilization activator [Smittium culicis]
MKNINGEMSDIGPFRTIKKWKTFYSCTVCREKRVKCDGIRPSCSTCATYDRTCNYGEVSISEEVTNEKHHLNTKALFSLISFQTHIKKQKILY